MPRTARSIQAGMIYHVLNRGNGRMQLFHKDQDFLAFERVLGEGLKRYPVDLLAYCLMPNHWHLVLRPRQDHALGKFMGWIGVTHVRRHHEHYHSRGGGHLYQGRFKSFPVQEDRHFLTLCRYVESNALRSHLSECAEAWPWGSAYARVSGDKTFPLANWPVDKPRHWLRILNESLREDESNSLRISLQRGRPFGNEAWIAKTAARLSLEYTLRNPGRPRKAPEGINNQ